MNEMSTTRMAGAILLIVIPGGALAGIIWHTLNNLLSGIVRPLELAAAIPATILFLLLLRVLGRRIERWADTDSTSHGHH